MSPQEAYEEDVSRCPTYEDGGARPMWHELPVHVARTWEKNPTPRGFEFCGERTRKASRQYAQGKAHGKQSRRDLLGQSPAYDRGHAIGASTRPGHTPHTTA